MIYAAILIAYLLGSIPFGYIVYKSHTGKDIRDAGSGNIGATNILRNLGKKAGIVVLTGDCLKGTISVLFALYLYNLGISLPFKITRLEFGLFIGLIAVIGHLFPIYIGFKGGKGVATALGIFLPIVPLAILIVVIVFIVIVWLTKYVSAASITGAIILPIAIHFIYSTETGILKISVLLSLFVIFKHRKNIKRLINGTENKIGKSVKKDD